MAGILDRYPADLPCGNPVCRERITWSASAGRPSRFCSTACRQRYNHERKRLLRDLKDTERHLARTDLTKAESQYVATRNAFVRWLLNGYGGAPGNVAEPA